MDTLKIVLISIASAIIVGFIASIIISSILSKRKDPNYRPVLNIKEKIISGLSIAIGVGIIVAGVVLPNKQNSELPDQSVNMNGEGVPDGELEDSSEVQDDSQTSLADDAQTGITGEELVEEEEDIAGAQVVY